MLVIAGHVKIDPAKMAEATTAAVEMMRETLAEPGCISYCFAELIGEPGTIRIFEEWESQEALDLHFKAPHMASFQKAMGGFGVSEMVVNRFEVSSKGPLG